ncbi:MAG: YbaB/EbfC family nucleoid-associated protein, partial [Lachnospiraceae bacterium]|nr:YbaB/EbfC family nucleoid-associated protein [Lachnospiraceae bacterium]
AKAGGGAVTVTVTGAKVIKNVEISKEVVDPDDVEMLQDLIVAATNEALALVDEENSKVMGKMTGGLGGFGF